ncbi:MAG TPA: choice-of-anchor X domain-containing protein, partial [Actinomycetota bacterium]
GLGQDIAKGDGIYSADWTPCAAGTYTLSYSNGATDTVTVTGLTPCITDNPPSGPPGSTTKVKGKGFSPGETVTITFDDTVLGTATADGTGRISTTITVPNGSTQGRHTITATGATSNLPTRASFRVT